MHSIYLESDVSNSYILNHLKELSFTTQVNQENSPIAIFENIEINTIKEYRKKFPLHKIILFLQEIQEKDLLEISPSFINKEEICIDTLYNQLIKIKKEVDFLRASIGEIHENKSTTLVDIEEFTSVCNLTKNEKLFLRLFSNSKQKTFQEEEILDYFSSKNSSISGRTLKNIISNIRKKVDTVKIINLYGEGYRVDFIQSETSFDLFLLDTLDCKLASARDLFTLNRAITSFLFEYYKCDRSIIIKIEKECQSILYEITDPKFPGAFEKNIQFSLKKQHWKLIKNAIELKEPYIINSDVLKKIFKELPSQWGEIVEPLSIIFFPVTIGNTIFLISMHQCSYKRVWKEQEVVFLKHSALNFLEKAQNFIHQ